MAPSSKPTQPDSYTVYDRAEVRQKLDELGIDSVGEIRRAHGSHRHRLARAQDTERLDLYATGTPDRVAADLDALASAKDRLVQQAAAVDELLREARRLATPMHDGHGPVAKAMRAAFHERAGEAEGVVRALTDYRDELTKVLGAIQQTMESYGRSELSARQRLSASGGADG
jgi:hypothetical protein